MCSRRPLLALLVVAAAACTVPDADIAGQEGDAAADGNRADTAIGFDTGGGTDSSIAPDVSDDSPSVDTAEAAVDAGRDLTTDKSKFFGASRCSSAKVLLCEDFESGTLDTSTWTTGGTAPFVDGVQHARGTKALHVKRVNNGNSTIKETKTFPAPSNRYYGRIFVWFEQLPYATTTPLFDFAHWTFVAASGTSVSGEIRISGMLQSGLNHFGVGTDNRTDPAGTGDWTNMDKDPSGKPLAVPTKGWTCIEWMHDGEHNETRFWWDGVEHPSMHTTESIHGGNTNPFILPQFTNVVIGWAEYQTTTETFEEWVDEIVIDKERIGCVL
jgi:hypothetical protein